MNERIVTISYQAYEGDIQPRPPQYLLSADTVRTGFLETLHINWVDGWWEVTNPKDDPERHWIGHADNQSLAILDYLRSRQGIPEQGTGHGQ